jgi:hypothetical protein
MFICDPCRQKDYVNDPSFSRSSGRCESCGENNVCSDIPSERLIMKPEKRFEYFAQAWKRSALHPNDFEIRELFELDVSVYDSGAGKVLQAYRRAFKKGKDKANEWVWG